jgi:hypothetical protein
VIIIFHVIFYIFYILIDQFLRNDTYGGLIKLWLDKYKVSQSVMSIDSATNAGKYDLMMKELTDTCSYYYRRTKCLQW